MKLKFLLLLLMGCAIAACDSALLRSLAPSQSSESSSYTPLPTQQLAMMAMSGDNEAKYVLGNRLCCGMDPQHDNAAGYQLICEAAKAELPQAQYRLGEIHQSGVSFSLSPYDLSPFMVPRDRGMAYFWYSLAAEKNYADAKQQKEALHEVMHLSELNRAMATKKTWQRMECDQFGKTKVQYTAFRF